MPPRSSMLAVSTSLFRKVVKSIDIFDMPFSFLLLLLLFNFFRDANRKPTLQELRAESTV